MKLMHRTHSNIVNGTYATSRYRFHMKLSCRGSGALDRAGEAT